MKFVTTGLLSASALLLLAPLASAQPAGEKRAALVQRLTDCRKVTEDAARLTCYDAAAKAFDTAEASGEIVVVDREGAKRVRDQAFGFRLPALNIFDRASGATEPLDRVTATLARAYQRGDGRWVLEMADGAVWTQSDDEPLRTTPEKGDKVEIRQAAMSGYFINVAGARAIRAVRVK